MTAKYFKWILIMLGILLACGILLIIIERSVIRSRADKPHKSEIRSQFDK